MRIKDKVLEPYSLVYDFGGWQVKEGETKGKGVPFNDFNSCITYIIQQKLAALKGDFTIIEFMKKENEIKQEVQEVFKKGDEILAEEIARRIENKEELAVSPSITLQE